MRRSEEDYERHLKEASHKDIARPKVGDWIRVVWDENDLYKPVYFVDKDGVPVKLLPGDVLAIQIVPSALTRFTVCGLDNGKVVETYLKGCGHHHYYSAAPFLHIHRNNQPVLVHSLAKPK